MINCHFLTTKFTMVYIEITKTIFVYIVSPLRALWLKFKNINVYILDKPAKCLYL